MYHIKDKKAAIREVQRYLQLISQNESMLPHITVDGFYSDETMIAVTEFQRKRNLASTGKVDKETFDMLFAEYSVLNTTDKYGYKFISGYDGGYRIGSSGTDVRIINLLLSELSKYYDSVIPVSGDFFNRETEQSVRAMQSIFGSEPNGVADENFVSDLQQHLMERKKLQN